jgi:hypothetical protein
MPATSKSILLLLAAMLAVTGLLYIHIGAADV